MFVDKFLNRLAFGHLSFDAWYHLSGQCMLFSIVFAGVGICKGIMGGRMLGEILPFYIVSFLGMYLYFSLSAMVDIKGKRRILKTNLIDYLENHLSGRSLSRNRIMKDFTDREAWGRRSQPAERREEGSVLPADGRWN